MIPPPSTTTATGKQTAKIFASMLLSSSSSVEFAPKEKSKKAIAWLDVVTSVLPATSIWELVPKSPLNSNAPESSIEDVTFTCTLAPLPLINRPMRMHCNSVMLSVCSGASKYNRSSTIAAVKVTLTKHRPRTPGSGTSKESMLPPCTQRTSVSSASGSGSGSGPRPSGTAAGRHVSPWPPAAHTHSQPLMLLVLAAKHTASMVHAPQSSNVTGVPILRSSW
ncbi:hypothetical protein ECC02_009171 [Trypanosoma cruzi]|uniref:Uncharacterized protein n=1 Tax=Trypanosoma cruzi TaxID=5693 RepID=A0A7J6XVA0_TRYCR|nr:hypothetical protein ECC02_009171 [Trypanosoma cruzi]